MVRVHSVGHDPARCIGCVDWSSMRTDTSAGGDTTNSIRYVGDSSIMRTDTTTFYFIR